MEIKTSVQEMMAQALTTALGGYVIGPSHVHSDESGWYYYIPAKSLLPGKPLVLCHYRGATMAVIPTGDWWRLETGEISVEDYIERSVWYFGRFSGGGSLLRGVFWGRFDAHGIKSVDKITHYLRSTSCHECTKASGYKPTVDQCRDCGLAGCPYSPLATEEDLDNCIHERDERHLLYRALDQYLEARFGLKAISCCSHPGPETILQPGYVADTLQVYFPQDLMVHLLYNPGQCGIDRYRENLQLVAAPHWYDHDHDARLVIDETIMTRDILEFWAAHSGESWLHPDQARSTTAEAHVCYEQEKLAAEITPSFFQRFTRWLFGGR